MEQVELVGRSDQRARDWTSPVVPSYAIELKHIRKVYAGPGSSREVFADVNLCAERGEFIAVLGPVGCGKTTLVNIIAGIDRPTSGFVRIQGTETARLSDDELSDLRASCIGLVPQVQNLLDDLTVAENVEVPLYFLRLDRKARSSRVAETLGRMGLESDSGRKVGALSVGERQMVAIGRALVSDPAVLVMDEPTESLDPVMSDMILELLRGDNMTRGRTLFVTTHDKKLSSMATRTIRLKKKIV
jgi:putative ABC transport system ATP-binding protein